MTGGLDDHPVIVDVEGLERNILLGRTNRALRGKIALLRVSEGFAKLADEVLLRRTSAVGGRSEASRRRLLLSYFTSLHVEVCLSTFFTSRSQVSKYWAKTPKDPSYSHSTNKTRMPSFSHDPLSVVYQVRGNCCSQSSGWHGGALTLIEVTLSYSSIQTSATESRSNRVQNTAFGEEDNAI